jgi:glycosyltransferase involved in cell wall biosynthesis
VIDPDEWIEGSELIIVSGGSTDRTNEILSEYKDNQKIKLILLEHRITKIIGVNLGVAHSRHDILVFSDCRQHMRKGSVKRLIAPLGNPEIGTVSSTLEDNKGIDKMSFVRNAMNWIAYNESAGSSSLNLFGALYAQRKSGYRLIPENILFDDIFVTVSTLIQRKKLIQTKEAVIHDARFKDYYKKERIEQLAGGLPEQLFR